MSQPGRVGPVVGVDQLGDVAVEVAHGRVELGKRHAHDGHAITLTTRCWTIGRRPRSVPRCTDEFPDDDSMRVAPETIYQALYVYGRGGLRKELAAHLRTHRTTRRPRPETARNRTRKLDPAMLVSIAERPDEVEGRLVPGHWEGDLIMGRDNKSQVATLVERTTGLVMLGQLDNKQAPTVAARLQERIQTLPAHLQRSLTWDRGTEMAAHTSFTIATGVKVYFCDPHAPWQRGSNENTNGLLRQYLPHGSDLSRFTQAELDAHRRQTQPPTPRPTRLPDTIRSLRSTRVAVTTGNNFYARTCRPRRRRGRSGPASGS